MNEARRLGHGFVALAAIAVLACQPQRAGEPDAAPAPGASANGAPSAPAATDPSAHLEHWEEARAAALRIPCRAIAVDGPVRTDLGDAGAALALQAEIPEELWLSLARDARLVAKDPRTTRETAFVGPGRVRSCVAHREESWLAAGRFESAIGAGETPGAEEWVVTPFGVIRYMAAKVAVDVRVKEAVIGVGTGPVFLWLGDGVRVTRVRSATGDGGSGLDSGAAPTVDDDGWLRVAEGEVTLSPGAARAAADEARVILDGCSALAGRAQQLAASLLEGHSNPDGSTAKEQMRTRRLARAACCVAALHVDTLPPSAQKDAMSTRLQGAASAWAAPPALPAAP